MSTVVDCTTVGGWPRDLPADLVCIVIDQRDLWPGDVVLIRTEDGNQGSLHFTGTSDWTFKDYEGEIVGTFKRPGWR